MSQTTKDQLGLFDRAAPYVKGSDTSKAAARSIEPDSKTLRGLILAFIRGRYPGGATCDEIERSMGLRHQTASARVTELRDAGYILDTGLRARTSSGRSAVAWVSISR